MSTMGGWIDWRSSWLGRCGRGVSQARVTQILNLTYLVPDIPRELFELEAIDRIEPMSERPLRRVLAEEDWGRQKRVFELVVGWGGDAKSRASVEGFASIGPF